jgi:hypothetical protein
LPNAGERLDEYILIHGHFIQTNTFVILRDLALDVAFDPECKIYEDTQFLIECWLTSGNYDASGAILSVYNDIGSSARLSKEKRVDRMQPILRFSRDRCSNSAFNAMNAFVAAEISIFRHPRLVAQSIWRGYLAGVPAERCVLYLFRSMFGSARVDLIARLLLAYRERRLRGHA